MKKTALISALLALVILTTCLFAACGKERTPATAESFRSTLEAKGYTVQDATASTQGGDTTNGVYIALNPESNLQVELYLMKSETGCASVYENNVANAKNAVSGTSSEAFVNLGSFQKFTQTDDSVFYIIARIGDTMLYCKTDKANADEAKAVFEELGYK